jgi:diaminohydroxyphosphoribosylaminopyrimidine deaminase/5-amino-6-(5-phosphoribosylamino)uracil reductase
LQIDSLLAELERRKFTNVLVEGGGELLGSLFDMNMVNEVHTFIAPILAGGCEAISPVEGLGVDTISAAKRLVNPHVEVIAGVVYIHGRLQSK